MSAAANNDAQNNANNMDNTPSPAAAAPAEETLASSEAEATQAPAQQAGAPQEAQQQQAEDAEPEHDNMQQAQQDMQGPYNGEEEFMPRQAHLLAALAGNPMMMEQGGAHGGMHPLGSLPPLAGGAAGGLGMQAPMGVELCRAYLSGRCSRGATCRFLHVENTSGHHPPNPHLCRDWLNGTCIRGNTCRFQHQGVSGSKASIHGGKGPWSVKTVLCHQWSSRGRCDYGTACKFAHAQRPGMPMPGVGMGMPGAMGMERWGDQNIDEKKLLAAMLSGMSPQEALAQAVANGQNNNAPANNGQTNGAQPAAANSQTSGGGSQLASAPNSPSSAPQADGTTPSPQPPAAGMDGAAGPTGPALNGLPMQQLVQPQKRADGSLILCRFYARHGYCKYGVACKFHHASGPGMFGGGAGGGMFPGSMGGNQLANILALGLKASMMNNVNEHLLANHAALLAASMRGPGGMDPNLASALAAYLQNQGPMGAHGHMVGPHAPMVQNDAGLGDPAFHAFLQSGMHGMHAHGFGFPAQAAAQFNSIPNLNANGAGVQGGMSGGAQGSANGLSLPQMINTAFRSTSGGVSSSSGSSTSNLSSNLSLMSLKPYADDASPTFGASEEEHARDAPGAGAFAAGADANAAGAFEAQRFGVEGYLPQQQQQQQQAAQQGTGSVIGGAPGASTLSALFGASLNSEPSFLH